MEHNPETGLYYFGDRYLDPQLSRWLSTDPAIQDYMPERPVDKKAKKRNKNLPGRGGVFNPVNLALYHYSGNNPISYKDPDGFDMIIHEAEGNNSQKTDYYLLTDLGFSVYRTKNNKEWFNSGFHTDPDKAAQGKRVAIVNEDTGEKYTTLLDLNILDGKIGEKQDVSQIKFEFSLFADLLTLGQAQKAKTAGGVLQALLPTDLISLTNTGLGIFESTTSNKSGKAKIKGVGKSFIPGVGTVESGKKAKYYEDPLGNFLEIEDLEE